MIEKLEKALKAVTEKIDCHDSADAMRFAQAALNISNAIATLRQSQKNNA